MKKQLCSFVLTKNIPHLLKDDWQKILADTDVFSLAKKMCVDVSSDEMKTNINPEILSLSSCTFYHWSGNSHKIYEPELNFPNLTIWDLFTPIYDPKTKKIKGVAFNTPYTKRHENSPIDILTDDNIEEAFSVQVLNTSVYPGGFKYWGDIPEYDDLFKKLKVEIGKEIYWSELSVIYRTAFPGKDANNLDEYYKNLVKLGLTPALDKFGYFACLTAGILADGATIKDFEVYAKQSIIKY